MCEAAVVSVGVLLWLIDVLVRVLLVPSLTLSAIHSVVHLPSVVFSITCDTNLCDQNPKRQRERRKSGTTAALYFMVPQVPGHFIARGCFVTSLKVPGVVCLSVGVTNFRYL